MNQIHAVVVLTNTFSLDWNCKICAQNSYYIVWDIGSTKAQPTWTHAYFSVFLKGEHTWNSHSQHQERQSEIAVNKVPGVLKLLKGRTPAAFRWRFIARINNSPATSGSWQPGLEEGAQSPEWKALCSNLLPWWPLISLYISHMYEMKFLMLVTQRWDRSCSVNKSKCEGSCIGPTIILAGKNHWIILVGELRLLLCGQIFVVPPLIRDDFSQL